MELWTVKVARIKSNWTVSEFKPNLWYVFYFTLARYPCFYYRGSRKSSEPIKGVHSLKFNCPQWHIHCGHWWRLHRHSEARKADWGRRILYDGVCGYCWILRRRANRRRAGLLLIIVNILKRYTWPRLQKAVQEYVKQLSYGYWDIAVKRKRYHAFEGAPTRIFRSLFDHYVIWSVTCAITEPLNKYWQPAIELDYKPACWPLTSGSYEEKLRKSIWSTLRYAPLSGDDQCY